MGNSSASITYIYISLWTTKNVYGQLKTSPMNMDPAIWVCLDMGKKLPCFSSFIVGKMMINKKIWGIANVQTKPFSWDILDVITQFFSWKIMGADPFQISNVQLTLVG
jgi:hypothetical protein